VRSSVQLPLSVGPPGGFVVLQASVPRAFDELARDATLVLPDGGLGVVLDRHLSRTTADQSAGDASGAGPSAPAWAPETPSETISRSATCWTSAPSTSG